MNTLADVQQIITNHYLHERKRLYREGQVPNVNIAKIAAESAVRIRQGEQKLRKLKLTPGDRAHFARLRKSFELFAKSLEIAAKRTNDKKAAELSRESDQMMQLYALTVLGRAVEKLEH